MKVTTASPTLECDFQEFWDLFLSKNRLANNDLNDFSKCLRGESTNRPRFRIPSADLKSDIFFDNMELFCRFASMPTPTQADFLRSVRKALTENRVEQIIISIPWSNSRDRKLRIRNSGLDVLDFEMA